MDTKVDERFDAFKRGRNIQESIDNLKQHWWEKEAKPELEVGIEKVMEKENVEKEVLEVMKELLKGVKIKKMSSYLEDMDYGKT